MVGILTEIIGGKQPGRSPADDDDIKIYVFYIDIRSFGKGFEDLFRRAKKEGVIFIRGLPAEISEDRKSHNMHLVGENTLEKKKFKINVEMVVLSVGLKPRDDSGVVQRLLRLSKTSDGFFMEAHPKLDLLIPRREEYFLPVAQKPRKTSRIV